MSAWNIGPGETYWLTDENGGVSQVRWGDLSWRTSFAAPYDINARDLPELLRKAYKQGREDQAELVRRSINFGKALS